MSLNQNIKNILIKYFTRFYVNNYKELVTHKINGLVGILYDSVETKKNEMFFKQSRKSIELTFKFLEHYGFNINENLVSSIKSFNNIFLITRDI